MMLLLDINSWSQSTNGIDMGRSSRGKGQNQQSGSLFSYLAICFMSAKVLLVGSNECRTDADWIEKYQLLSERNNHESFSCDLDLHRR
jgi:hypothetical protein